MATQEQPRMTEADVRSLADKLERFSAGLSPAERAILGMVLQRGAAATPEVDGYGWGNTAGFPTPGLNVQAQTLGASFGLLAQSVFGGATFTPPNPAPEQDAD